MSKTGSLRISNHEMSHFVVYLFLGGNPDDVKDMQIKQKVGYFDQISFSIANNNFARACVSLAGPVSDQMIGVDYKGCDLSNAKTYISYAGALLSISAEKKKEWEVSELERAKNLTQSILLDQNEMINELKNRGLEMINGSSLITKNKLQKLAKEVIRRWDDSDVKYYKHPSLVK